MTTEEINEKLKNHLYRVVSWALSWPESKGANRVNMEAMAYLDSLEPSEENAGIAAGKAIDEFQKTAEKLTESKTITVTNCQECPFVNNDNEFGYDGCNLEHVELANNESMPNNMPHKDCVLRKGRHLFKIADATDTRWMEPKYVEFNVETDMNKIANDLEP